MYSVPNLQAYLLATICEDAIIQLRILGECNNELRKFKTVYELFRLYRKKYDVKPPEVNDELRYINPDELDCEHYKLNKINDDRMLCEKVLSDTYLELSLKKAYGPLTDYIQAVQDKSQHYLFLIEDVAQNKILRRETMKQLRQQRNRMKSKLYDVGGLVDCLTLRVEEAILNKETEERYIDKWQDSRLEQNKRCIQKKEEERSETIAYYHKKLEDEQHIHYNLELFINIRLTEVLKRVENVMIMYDKDIEAIEVKVQRMHTNYEDQLLKRRELEKKLADRQVKVKNWLQYKKEREIARVYRIKMSQAAVIVQAWWRGLLVRRNLGPFKKNKKLLKKRSKKWDNSKH